MSGKLGKAKNVSTGVLGGGGGGAFTVAERRTWELIPLLSHGISEAPHAATVYLSQGKDSWGLPASLAVVSSRPPLFFVAKSPSC